ncbi:MAG TPA: hypothetical protein HA346_01045 [Thermoplasmata archaeon]|nr:hypothetical protein [Thermoplasmata archaeon]
MGNEYILILDAGTGAGRCVILDAQGNLVSQSYREWRYFSPPEVEPLGMEFDPALFWNILSDTIKEAMKAGDIPKDKIIGISATSQREGLVFLDTNGGELYAGPNMDMRGVLTQGIIEEELGDALYKITGQGPPFFSAATKLLWFKEEKPEVYVKISRMLMLSDWILFKLTGEYAAEPSNASSSLVFDIHKCKWSDEIIEKLELSGHIFPKMHQASEQIGTVTKEASEKCNLVEGTPVIIGGADTQSSLVGSGAIKDGDVGIVAGSNTQIQMVVPSPIIDSKERIWTSCHLLHGKWVLESNAGMTGLIYKWLKDNILSYGSSMKGTAVTYEQMDELASQVPPGSCDAYASLGADIMNVQQMHVVRPGIFLFPPPANPLTAVPVGMSHLIRATIENLTFVTKGNMTQVEDISNRKVEGARMNGGMAKSKLWPRILADVLDIPISIPKVKEGASLGCAICVAIGVGKYKDYDEAIKSMVKFEKIIEPDKVIHEKYNSHYERWKKLYNEITELA